MIGEVEVEDASALPLPTEETLSEAATLPAGSDMYAFLPPPPPPPLGPADEQDPTSFNGDGEDVNDDDEQVYI